MSKYVRKDMPRKQKSPAIEIKSTEGLKDMAMGQNPVPPVTLKSLLKRW